MFFGDFTFHRLGVLLLSLLCVQVCPSALAGEPESGAPSSSEAQEQHVVAKMLERSRAREQRLQEYSVAKTYQLRNEEGKTRAEAQVVLQFQAPNLKRFRTVSEYGSMIGQAVFREMQQSEVEGARNQVTISPENYQFDLVGEEWTDGKRCFVFAVKPLRKERLLFEGRIWVDAEEFAIVKIAGRPARNPSWWIKNSEFVRHYGKVGDFWLPVRDESISQVRLWGKNVLVVDYNNYQVVPKEERGRPVPASAPRAQPTAARTPTAQASARPPGGE